MDVDRTASGSDGLEVAGVASGLAALARINFGPLDPVQILAVATNAAASLASCRVDASYRAVEGEMVLCPPSQSERPELEDRLQRSRWNGWIEFPQRDWAWAFPLRHATAI